MSVMLLRTLFTLLIAPILFSLLVSTLVRALLYITYSDYFSTITFIALIETFAYGLRFDLSITTISYVIFLDRKSTRLNSSHVRISYAVFCLKKKINIRMNYYTNW